MTTEAIRARFDLRRDDGVFLLDDGHLIVELKYLQAMHVKNRMLKKCCYTLYLVSAPAGPPLKALEGMDKKECNGARRAGVPRRPAGGATLVADGAKKVVFQYGRPGNGTDYLVALARLAETDPLRLEFDELAPRRAAAAADELPVDWLQRVPDPGLMNLPTIWPRMRFPSARDSAPSEGSFRVQEALRSLENAFSEFMPERFYGINDRAKDGCPAGKVMALASIPGVAKAGDGCIVFGLYDYRRVDGRRRELLPRPAASSSRARRPPAARVAKLYVVPNCEVVTPPPPPIYHVTENGERLLVLYATRVQRPLIPAIQQVEMAAAMFDSRPIEIARPLLFESEEDAERRAEPARPAQRKSRRRSARCAPSFPCPFNPDDPLRSQAAAAAPPPPPLSGDEAAPAAAAREPAAAPEAPAEAPVAPPPTAPPVEAPAEAPAPAAPAKKKKKKRSRRRRAARRDRERERTRMRNIAAGNKKLYSLGLIHLPPASSPTPAPWWSERARTAFFACALRRALPQAQS
ncbi:hypothetical protein JL720_16150 [Aureococcus anophagefferens]|nr:hypothetical protein JL720_16150 [Aureococcus anophagefferens]